MSLLSELKRRNVIRVGVFYVVAAWLILQVAELLFDVLGVPDWSLKFVLAMLLLGFPVVLIFSWVYELTPDGLKRESATGSAIASVTASSVNAASRSEPSWAAHARSLLESTRLPGRRT